MSRSKFSRKKENVRKVNSKSNQLELDKNSPDVEFCGYSLPHPSDDVLNLRLQTRTKPANEVLKDGLETIISISDILEKKYRDALSKST